MATAPIDPAEAPFLAELARLEKQAGDLREYIQSLRTAKWLQESAAKRNVNPTRMNFSTTRFVSQ